MARRMLRLYSSLTAHNKLENRHAVGYNHPMAMVPVTVPVYTVEQYLPTCLAPFLVQALQNWDGIYVDSGSFDGRGAIPDRYAAAENRNSFNSTAQICAYATPGLAKKQVGEVRVNMDNDKFNVLKPFPRTQVREMMVARLSKYMCPWRGVEYRCL